MKTEKILEALSSLPDETVIDQDQLNSLFFKENEEMVTSITKTYSLSQENKEHLKSLSTDELHSMETYLKQIPKKGVPSFLRLARSYKEWNSVLSSSSYLDKDWVDTSLLFYKEGTIPTLNEIVDEISKLDASLATLVLQILSIEANAPSQYQKFCNDLKRFPKVGTSELKDCFQKMLTISQQENKFQGIQDVLATAELLGNAGSKDHFFLLKSILLDPEIMKRTDLNHSIIVNCYLSPEKEKDFRCIAKDETLSDQEKIFLCDNLSRHANEEFDSYINEFKTRKEQIKDIAHNFLSAYPEEEKLFMEKAAPKLYNYPSTFCGSLLKSNWSIGNDDVFTSFVNYLTCKPLGQYISMEQMTSFFTNKILGSPKNKKIREALLQRLSIYEEKEQWACMAFFLHVFSSKFFDSNAKPLNLSEIKALLTHLSLFDVYWAPERQSLLASLFNSPLRDKFVLWKAKLDGRDALIRTIFNETGDLIHREDIEKKVKMDLFDNTIIDDFTMLSTIEELLEHPEVRKQVLNLLPCYSYLPCDQFHKLCKVLLHPFLLADFSLYQEFLKELQDPFVYQSKVTPSCLNFNLNGTLKKEEYSYVIENYFKSKQLHFADAYVRLLNCLSNATISEEETHQIIDQFINTISYAYLNSKDGYVQNLKKNLSGKTLKSAIDEQKLTAIELKKYVTRIGKQVEDINLDAPIKVSSFVSSLNIKGRMTTEKLALSREISFVCWDPNSSVVDFTSDLNGFVNGTNTVQIKSDDQYVLIKKAFSTQKQK